MPKGKPLILAVNHPTAFLDPAIVGGLMTRVLHFILRGDMFKTPFISWVLGQIKTIPIFRFRDGYSALKNNSGTIDAVSEKLAKGENIMVLAEGSMVDEKRMRPIQKGTARMAFDVWEKYKRDDLFIVPVGINYTDSGYPRTLVMIDVGKPIALRDYLVQYQEQPRHAINDLTREISARMRKRIVHIEDPADDDLVNKLQEVNRNNRTAPWMFIVSNDKFPLREEMRIAETVNQMDDEEKRILNAKTKEYFDLLNENDITDLAVAKPQFYSIVNTFLISAFFPIFFLGTLANFIPVSFGKIVADKKVNQADFYASVRYGMTMFAFGIYYLLIFILALVWGSWKGLLLLASMPVLGYVAIVYSEYFLQWNDARKFNQLDGPTSRELRALRDDLKI